MATAINTLPTPAGILLALVGMNNVHQKEDVDDEDNTGAGKADAGFTQVGETGTVEQDAVLNCGMNGGMNGSINCKDSFGEA
jgi:hypothetical protein